jgi:hypothetical protein
MIKLYNQLLQEMTARFSSVRKSEEPIGRARTKEEEQDLLKVMIRNQNTKHKKTHLYDKI